MAETLSFELVSPEELLLSADVLDVTVPGTDGEFGVLPKHAPFISTLRPGILTVRMEDGKTREIFVRGGFAEAGPEALTVLAEEATPVEDIDANELSQSISDAEDDVKDAKDDATRAKAETTLNHLKEVQTALSNR